MSKSADAFRTISEVADWLNVPTHVLRFWESKFTQIKPVKRAGGRRYYRPKDMLIIGGIKKLLHDDGITIKGAQQIIREQGVMHLVSLSQPLDDDISAEDNTPPRDEISTGIAHSVENPAPAAVIDFGETAPEPADTHPIAAESIVNEDDQFDLFAPRPADPASAEPQPAPNLWAPQNVAPAPIIAPRYADIVQALDATGKLQPGQATALRPLLEQIKSAWDRRLG